MTLFHNRLRQVTLRLHYNITQVHWLWNKRENIKSSPSSILEWIFSLHFITSIMLISTQYVVVLRFRLFVTRPPLSLRRPAFKPSPVRVGWGRWNSTRIVFSPSTPVFPNQYKSTHAWSHTSFVHPYITDAIQEKLKTSLNKTLEWDYHICFQTHNLSQFSTVLSTIFI